MRKLNYCIIIVVAVIFAQRLTASTFEYRGAIEDRFTRNIIRKNSPLNPEEKVFAISDYEQKLWLNFGASWKPLSMFKFTAKVRPSWMKKENWHNEKLYIDNAYLDWNIGENIFATIGKINLIEGVGLSYNPSDFFNEKKEMDYTEREEDRKFLREGNYLIRIEALWRNKAISGVIAPNLHGLQNEKARYQAKGSINLSRADLSLHVFKGTNWAGGGNISFTLGDNLELHQEIACCEGSDRKYLYRKQEIGPFGSGIFEYQTGPLFGQNRVIGRIIMGGHYTLPNKNNILLEYFYNQDGYTKSEWENLVEVMEDNSENLLSPPIGVPAELFKGNLGLANSIMTYRTLRRHYIFFRFWMPELLARFDFSQSILANMNDGSIACMPLLEYSMMDNAFAIEMGSTILFGNKTAEFGLSPTASYCHMGARWRF